MTSFDHGTGRFVPLARLLGAALALLALDQTRRYLVADYTGKPPAGLFVTNLVTQACVPVVVFLVGLMIPLHHGSARQPVAISRWLAGRGLLLIALDLTVVRMFGVQGSASVSRTPAGWPRSRFSLRCAEP